MKKSMSLLLAFLLCLCTLLPAAAEEPIITRAPMTVDAFKNSYNQFFAAYYPDSTISWFSKELDGQQAWGALMNDELPMLMLLMDNDVVSTITIKFEGPLTEDTISVFMIQCALAGGTLLTLDGVSAKEALIQAFTELETALIQAMQGGSEDFPLWGMGAKLDVSTADGTTYDFMLVLTFGADK